MASQSLGSSNRPSRIPRLTKYGSTSVPTKESTKSDKPRYNMASSVPISPNFSSCTSSSVFPRIKEPLTPDMKAEVVKVLKKFYKSHRREEFAKEMKYYWLYSAHTLNLGDPESKIELGPAKLKMLCNKLTFFYWAYAARWKGHCPMLPFGSIYKEWFRYHGDEPNIEFGHFFTCPIRITSTGPETIAGILKVHKSICEQGCSLLSEMNGAYSKIHLSPWPKPQQYKLLPLCRAIVVLIDQLSPAKSLQPGEFVYVDEYAQEQSVLMIRTGDESYLSAPISFESIREHSLPLDRSDITARDEIDAVRVSLTTAIRFITDLERREDDAYPYARDRSLVDTSLDPYTPYGVDEIEFLATSADEWADKIMQDVEKKGINNVGDAQLAVYKIQAAKNGDFPHRNPPYFFDGRWR
jgi:hypothetical protein